MTARGLLELEVETGNNQMRFILEKCKLMHSDKTNPQHGIR